ncbi:MAG: Maf family protein [Rhodospirillales bacterium]
MLASASSARAQVLDGAGIPYLRDPATIDEGVIKSAFRAKGAAAAAAAEALALAKAEAVSRRHRGALVVGADQILQCGDAWLDKPADGEQAASHLRTLRGRTHSLVSAVCVVRDGERAWHHVETSRLTMWAFDDAFIERYLVRAGQAALESLGAYRLEGLGMHLFSDIEGDFFAILGLPLLPLLAFLRRNGWGEA